MSDTRRFAAAFLAGFVRYFPGVLAVVSTLGVSILTHLTGLSLGFLTAVTLAVPPAALLASGLAWVDREPSGVHLLLVAGLSWGLFSLARIPLVDPAAGRLVGSPLALLDLGLVWAGSYAVAGGLVYGTDWSTLGADADTDSDGSQPDVADD